MCVQLARRRTGSQAHGWTETQRGCELPHSLKVQGARSERLVQLLGASDEVNRGSEQCLKPRSERPWRCGDGYLEGFVATERKGTRAQQRSRKNDDKFK